MILNRQARISFWIVGISASTLLSYLLLLGCSSQYIIVDSIFKTIEGFLAEIGIVIFLCLLGGLLGILDAYGQWLRHRNYPYHYAHEIVAGILLLAIFIAFLYPFITRDLVIKGTNALVISEFKKLGTLAQSHYATNGESYEGFCESETFKKAQSTLATIETHEGALCARKRTITCRTNENEFAFSINNSYGGSEPIYLCLDTKNTHPVGSELPITGTRCEEI